MLGLHYDSNSARETAATIARHLSDAAYRTSVELATFRPNEIREAVLSAEKNRSHPVKGIHCPQCGNPDLWRIDGCNYCNRCGFDSECG
jgi:hypothetical protein